MAEETTVVNPNLDTVASNKLEQSITDKATNKAKTEPKTEQGNDLSAQLANLQAKYDELLTERQSNIDKQKEIDEAEQIKQNGYKEILDKTKGENKSLTEENKALKSVIDGIKSDIVKELGLDIDVSSWTLEQLNVLKANSGKNNTKQSDGVLVGKDNLQGSSAQSKSYNTDYTLMNDNEKRAYFAKTPMRINIK